MSKTFQRSLLSVSLAAAVVACGRGNTATQDEFANDLKLAQSSTMDLATPKVDPALLNSLETRPEGAPEVASTVKKASGNRAVRSKTPTVRATPDVDLASTDDVADEVTTVVEAPAPDIEEPAAVAPRPSPAPTAGVGDGMGDYGTSGNGGGIFGPGGGIGGVVIRGGGADGDHCEIHTGRTRTRGPIFIPAGTVPSAGGMGIPRGSGGGIGARRPGGQSTVGRGGSVRGTRGRR